MSDTFSEQALASIELLRTCNECGHPASEHLAYGAPLLRHPSYPTKHGGLTAVEFKPGACYHERFVSTPENRVQECSCRRGPDDLQ